MNYIDAPTIPEGMTCAEYRKQRHRSATIRKAWKLAPVIAAIKLKLA